MSTVIMNKRNAIKKTRSDRIFDIVNYGLLIIITLVMLYPLYFTIIASISDPYEVSMGNVVLLPAGCTLEAYQNVIEEERIWIGYRNSFYYMIVGTIFNLVLTIPCGYAWAKKDLPLRKFFTWYLLIPMYFTGGMIPTYLQIKDLGLLNTPWVLVLVGGISIYNTIITRAFFQNSIPEEIYESARIDGANDFRCFFSIALPLAKPIIAVIALYYAVAHWNAYFNALLYVSKIDYQPLQLVLRSILLLNEGALANLDMENADIDMILEMTRRAYVAQAMKYALIFIASAPLLAIYPFVQKHFVKGVMIGSLKG